MEVLKFIPLAESRDYEDADFSAMLAVWGNGNARLGYLLFYRVTMRLVHARTEHPRFAEGKEEAAEVIGCEFVELKQAIAEESKYRQEDEALDVVATALRFLGGEHEQR